MPFLVFLVLILATEVKFDLGGQRSFSKTYMLGRTDRGMEEPSHRGVCSKKNVQTGNTNFFHLFGGIQIHKKFF